MGASLLVFKNKSDVPGSMSADEIREVRSTPSLPAIYLCNRLNRLLISDN